MISNDTLSSRMTLLSPIVISLNAPWICHISRKRFFYFSKSDRISSSARADPNTSRLQYIYNFSNRLKKKEENYKLCSLLVFFFENRKTRKQLFEAKKEQKTKRERFDVLWCWNLLTNDDEWIMMIILTLYYTYKNKVQYKCKT